MRKIVKKISLFFEKIPILAYILVSFVKSFLIVAVTVPVIYGILWVTGIYSNIETALDLKYNSPIILAPMWVLIALFVVCFVIGFLMYFHKYKRGKTKTKFYNAIAPILNKNNRKS
ncbi:MAG: hypothetical protein UE295_07290 [Acutalibacteraceae bacterium]|nr:hypothetical protein [Acutalibacteraceae bacterium]